MVIAVKNEVGTAIGYIIEEDEEEGSDSMEEVSREVVQAIIEEKK